jgi:hypothetical protein
MVQDVHHVDLQQTDGGLSALKNNAEACVVQLRNKLL